jgi:hypothetical protein
MLNPEVLVAARQRVQASGWGERSRVVNELAGCWGISVSQVWRILDLDTGRKRRSDQGETILTDADLQKMAAYLVRSMRDSGVCLGSVKRGKEILLRSGEISLASAQASDATWNRQLRKHGLAKEFLAAPSLATEVATRFPNDWHMVDASIAILFYLTPKGKMEFERFDLADPKNKPQEWAKKVRSRLLLVRWVLVDCYSGAVVVDYREASGENTRDLLDFLHYAWSPKNDRRWPFHGIPFNLGADQGAPQKSSYVDSLASVLGFSLHLHRSSHERKDAPAARASGDVETIMRVWEENFESRWRLNPPTGGLAQVRDQARDFCIALNSSEQYRLRSTDFTRSQLWLDIREEHIRLPPPLHQFRELAISSPFSRVLDAYGRVRIDGDFYKIPSCPWYPGEELQVRRNAWEPEKVEVVNPRTGEMLDAFKLEITRTGKTSAAVYRGEKEEADKPVSGRQPKHTAARLRETVDAEVKAKSGLWEPGKLDTGLGTHAETVKVEFAPRTGTLVLPAVSGRRIDLWDAFALASQRLGRELNKADTDFLEARLTARRFDELEALRVIEELAAQQGQGRKLLTLGGGR